MRSLDRLNAWIARAHDIGVVALDTETTSLDPMQATLCGFSLAVAPNEACYVPLGHREAATAAAAACSRGDARARSDSGSATRSPRSSRCWKTRACSRSAQNLKFDWQIFALRGIEIAPYDDTMLMSYVLDAGRGGHGLDALAQRYFDHAAIDLNELITAPARSRITFDCVADRARPPNTPPRTPT